METEHNKQMKDAEQQAGYPDISKADTKFIVIVSLICLAVIFLLSIFFPENETAEKDKSSTETTVTTEAAADTSSLYTPSFNQIDTYSTPSNSISVKQSGSSITSSFLGNTLTLDTETGFVTDGISTYYYGNGTTPLTGWLTLDGNSYYFQEDGTMVTGWYTMEGHDFYFDNDGLLQTNQWIDDKYLGEDGCALTDTVTPDGFYVRYDGTKEDGIISLETSQEGLSDLKSTLETMIDGYSGTWSIYVKDINSNEYLEINNIQHFSASLIKLYCAAAVYDLMDKGTLAETETIDSLMSAMISVSDNDAFNLLVMNCAENHSHVTGRGVIQDYIDENGYVDTTITSILTPTKYKAPSSPGRNYTTVTDCGLLLEKIYKGQCVSREASEDFLELLLNQSNTSKIPAGLPDGIKCANKTGDTDDVQHDAAIVYSPNGTYILCIMSSNCGNAITNCAKISTAVYEYFNN